MNTLDNKKICCIGAGNMGSAIISGLSNKILIDNLFIIDNNKQKQDEIKNRYKIKTGASTEELVGLADIVIVAVKPADIPALLDDLSKIQREKIIVSIAAGIKIAFIENKIGSDKKIVRVMPNTPALIGDGMAVLSPNKNVDEISLISVREIFSCLGKVLVMPEEYMDAVTGLSGSGPAYVFTFIQALTDGGVKMGIPRDKALVLSAQTVLGAAKMVLEGNEGPIDLRGRVTSPGGTTIEALHILERAGFSGIIMDAVEAAAKKSKELG